jgi:sortase (surface protein transpeptidase)
VIGRGVARRVALVVLVVAALTAAAGFRAVAAHDDRAAPPVPGGPPTGDAFRSVRTYEEVAEPVRLRIPAIGVDTALERLGRAADRSVEVPADFGVAGWFAEGPRPGAQGPAVVLGHVDSRSGPAVFFRVAELRRDAEVRVDRADGSTVTFRVRDVQRVAKDAFPTDLVYGATLQPSLRLVTCGGSFDRATGSYRDNVIVYADLAD